MVEADLPSALEGHLRLEVVLRAACDDPSHVAPMGTCDSGSQARWRRSAPLDATISSLRDPECVVRNHAEKVWADEGLCS